MYVIGDSPVLNSFCTGEQKKDVYKRQGMERAVKMALKESGKKIPVKTVVISTEGEIL